MATAASGNREGGEEVKNSPRPKRGTWSRSQDGAVIQIAKYFDQEIMKFALEWHWVGPTPLFQMHPRIRRVNWRTRRNGK